MKLFRIALKKFGATAQEALSGKSGFLADGRWHTHERHLDYTAESLSLATLERLVHYKRFDCLAPHVLYVLDIPDAQIEINAAIPRGWDGADLLPGAQAIGNLWYDQGRGPAFRVPSAVTRGETNVMVNTHQAAWNWGWVQRGPMAFEFDRRLAEAFRPMP